MIFLGLILIAFFAFIFLKFKNKKQPLSVTENKKAFSIKYEDSTTGFNHYIIVDSETNGLPILRNGDPKEVDNWPRILQLSWMVLDTDFNKVVFKNYFIKTDFEIDTEAKKIHGLTKEFLDENGNDIDYVLNDFLEDLNKTQILIAHNLDFDVPIIDAELIRSGKKRVLFRKRKICTLKYGVGLTRVFNDFRKYPSLPFLCQMLFGGVEKDFEFHDARKDVLLTAKVFQKLIEYDVVKPLWIRPK